MWSRARTIVLGLCLLPLLARAEPSAGLEARARAIVDEERARAGTPALSVAIFGHGRVLASFAVGEADLEARRAATPETAFPAASVTKILTAALVMHQVERGALALDADVNASLPPERQVRDAAGAPVAVTLRQLLSHSSGLPVSWAGIQADPAEPPRALDDLLAHGLRTVRAPGEKLIYANDAFALAGWLAARAAGTSFDELARAALFEPLGMTRSTLVPPRDAGPELAAAYGGMFGGRERVPHQTVSGTSPAGALITTAPDLARFGLALLGKGEWGGVRVLAAESVAEMMTLQARTHPRMPEGFGLGFGVREQPGRKLVWWDGSLAGAASRLALLPEHGVGVAILSNLADNAPVAVSARRILELLVPPAERPAAPASADGAIAGRYRFVDLLDPSARLLEWFVNLRVEPGEGGLELRTPISNPARLVPAGDGLFVLDGPMMLDGAYVHGEGERLWVGFLEARRVPAWQSATAILAYLGAAALALLGALAFGAYRLLRRLRGQPKRLA